MERGRYFALIGAGFMLAEIALIQRLSVYLGHPVYALGVLLFSDDRLGKRRQPAQREDPRDATAVVSGVSPVVAAALILASAATGYAASHHGARILCWRRCWWPSPWWPPVAALMGLCFPAGMRLLGRVDEHEAPWYSGPQRHLRCPVLGTGGVPLHLLEHHHQPRSGRRVLRGPSCLRSGNGATPRDSGASCGRYPQAQAATSARHRRLIKRLLASIIWPPPLWPPSAGPGRRNDKSRRRKELPGDPTAGRAAPRAACRRIPCGRHAPERR